MQGNPVGANIEEGTTAFRSGSHDGVIAIGGGSAMDAGKVIAMYQGQESKLFRSACEGRGWAQNK